MEGMSVITTPCTFESGCEKVKEDVWTAFGGKIWELG